MPRAVFFEGEFMRGKDIVTWALLIAIYLRLKHDAEGQAGCTPPACGCDTSNPFGSLQSSIRGPLWLQQQKGVPFTFESE